MDELEKLRAENEQLKKMNAIKSDWISISAHQLRTTLSAIKWILKMFLDGDFGKMSPEQNGFMKKAFDSNERMLDLVNEMLSLNHIDQTSLRYDFEKHNMIDLIDSVLFDFTGESYKKGVEIVFLKPTAPIPPLTFDLEKIRVVLQNLIENAIKYGNTGTRVFISAQIMGDFVEVHVKDTGIGIPEADQKLIFTKFFRATNAKTKDSVGSGLGLFTTKAIIEKHGGKMWFESGEDQGTTFSFTLPVVHDPKLDLV